jgi:endonuclease/exonuclease/phosphatase family metal-dependent hydrolase
MTELKTLTWNIGGGKLLAEGEDPGLMSSYNVDAIEEIASQVKAHNPDIVTIQEAHGDDNDNQVAQIARKLGYTHYFYDPISDSHIDSTYKLGNGLISRFPISDIKKGRFLNPKIHFELEGRKAFTHDKGYGSCNIKIEAKIVYATTLHLIPFRSVGLEFDTAAAQNILKSIEGELSGDHKYELIQGDFNIHSPVVRSYLPSLFDNNLLDEVELNEPTTPKGRMYDHVLYKGFRLKTSVVDSSVKTDHYPVICNFEVLDQ